MSRHEIKNEVGRAAFGWDNMLQSFYLQMYNDNLPEDDNPVIWLGATDQTRMYEVEDLVRIAKKNGLEIAYPIQVKLYGEKDDGI